MNFTLYRLFALELIKYLIVIYCVVYPDYKTTQNGILLQIPYANIRSPVTADLLINYFERLLGAWGTQRRLNAKWRDLPIILLKDFSWAWRMCQISWNWQTCTLQIQRTITDQINGLSGPNIPCSFRNKRKNKWCWFSCEFYVILIKEKGIRTKFQQSQQG